MAYDPRPPTRTIASVNAEIDQWREALRLPTIALVSSRYVYRKLEKLHRELDSLEKDTDVPGGVTVDDNLVDSIRTAGAG